MSDYEVYWLADFLLIIYWVCQEIIMMISQKKQTNKYKEKFIVDREHSYKSKETRMFTYTCRYFTGYLIPIIQLCQDELEIKCSLEYLQV